MSATSQFRPDTAAYLAAVREALADLPADERDDLVAEVEVSLIESADESEGSIAARLGPPGEFAAELRAAAGLHAPAAAAARASPLRTWADAAAPAVAALKSLGRELAPIWWVARAYLLVAGLALAADAEWVGRPAAVPRLNTVEGGLAAIAAAIVVSVALGLLVRRRDGEGRRLATVANLVLAAAAIPVAAHLADVPPAALAPAPAPAGSAGLAYKGVPVDNLYPFTRDGRLLQDVLLYDGAGRPLEIRPGATDPLRRVLRTRTGERVFNSFPIRYYDPGTRTVAHPAAAPPVSVPEVRTPPLRPRP